MIFLGTARCLWFRIVGSFNEFIGGINTKFIFFIGSFSRENYMNWLNMYSNTNLSYLVLIAELYCTLIWNEKEIHCKNATDSRTLYAGLFSRFCSCNDSISIMIADYMEMLRAWQFYLTVEMAVENKEMLLS